MSAIVRLDKIGKDTHLVSGTLETDLENGTVVARGALNADGETYTMAAPTDVTADDLFVHVSEVFMYDERKNEDEFVLKAGKAGRFYKVREGEILTISDNGITGATTLNQFVIPANGATKMAAAATIPGTGTPRLAFQVIAKETYHGVAASVLQVVRAL